VKEQLRLWAVEFANEALEADAALRGAKKAIPEASPPLVSVQRSPGIPRKEQRRVGGTLDAAPARLGPDQLTPSRLMLRGQWSTKGQPPAEPISRRLAAPLIMTLLGSIQIGAAREEERQSSKTIRANKRKFRLKAKHRRQRARATD
jgi:hypothetical protein